MNRRVTIESGHPVVVMAGLDEELAERAGLAASGQAVPVPPKVDYGPAGTPLQQALEMINKKASPGGRPIVMQVTRAD